jgi:hypothetical protein
VKRALWEDTQPTAPNLGRSRSGGEQRREWVLSRIVLSHHPSGCGRVSQSDRQVQKGSGEPFVRSV